MFTWCNINRKWFATGIVLLCSLYVQLTAQQKKADSLFALLKTDKEDTNKVAHLNILGQYFTYRNPDSSLSIGKQALLLAEKLKFKTGIAVAASSTGTCYRIKADYERAHQYYYKALQNFEELGNRKQMAGVLNNIGNVFREQSNYSKAVDFYFKALKINEEIGNKNWRAINLGNIAIVYFEEGQYDKALECNLTALKINTEEGNKTAIAINLLNIGNIYTQKAAYDRALEYYFKSLKIAEETGNENGVAIVLSSIGIVYNERGENTKALEVFFKAKKMTEESGDKNELELVLDNIGRIYSEQGEYLKSYDYLYRALGMSQELGTLNSTKGCYEELSKLYQTSTIPLMDSTGGRLLGIEQMRLRALYYYKRSIAIRDTLFSEESKKQLLRKEMNFEFEKKEAATKAEQLKNEEIARAESRKQKVIIAFTGFGLLVVVVFAVFILRALRITRRQKKQIEEQKNLVDEKQREILDSIYYARRIQRALITNEKYISKCLSALNRKV